MIRTAAHSRLALAGVALAAVAGLAGCGTDAMSASASTGQQASGASGLPSGLVQRVDAAYEKAGRPSGEVPELDSEATCPLDLDVRIGGREPEEFGSGASTIGESGHRVVCDYSDPSSTLSVGRLTNPAELTELEDNAGPQQEAGNEQTGSTETVGNRHFTVVRTTYPTNDSHIDYSVTITDPAQLAYAVLQVETTGEARQTYSSAQAAQDLAAILDSAA